MSILEEKWTRKIWSWVRYPKTTNLVWSCRENGPNTTTKNYDSLKTWRKEKTRPFPKNLERWNIHSHEWKRSKHGWTEQPKAMEYGSWKVSSDVLKPRNIYILHFYSTKYHRQQPLYNTLELLMMGIVMPETCWASNQICNKNLCCI